MEIRAKVRGTLQGLLSKIQMDAAFDDKEIKVSPIVWTDVPARATALVTETIEGREQTISISVTHYGNPRRDRLG